MRALVLEEPGEEPRMAVREVDTPRVGPGDVLVKVRWCGLCFHDVVVMQGVLRRGVKPNIILGHEISGEVAEVGEGVTSFSPGDPVVSLLTEACGQCIRCRSGREYRCLNGKGIGHALDGGFAEYVRLQESSLVALPPGLDLDHACILACPMGVALQALRDVARTQPGETVAVVGAGGGLGLHSLQLAKALGAKVLAVTTSPEKMEGIQEAGADEVILADELDFAELIMAFTEDTGADVVVNPVGSLVFDSCFRSLAQFGRMVIIGEISGGEVAINPAEILFKDATIMGSSGTGLKQVKDVAEMVIKGQVRPIISQTLPLEEAAAAYRLMREKQTFGRIALAP